MHAIFQSLPALIDELPDKNARAAIVMAIWPNVIGPHLREQSAVTELNDGLLQVSVSGVEWKREFEQHAAAIVYKLNRALGSSIVRRLDLKVDRKSVESARSRSVREHRAKSVSESPSALRKSAEEIADPKLRENFLAAASACIERRDSN